MKLFLTSGHTNNDLLGGLRSRFSKEGFEVYSDSDAAQKSWTSELERAEVVVLLVPPAAEVTRLVRDDWAAILEAVFRDPQKRLIPVLLSDEPPPAFLRKLSRLKYSGASVGVLTSQISERLKDRKGALAQLEQPDEIEAALMRQRLQEIKDAAEAMSALAK